MSSSEKSARKEGLINRGPNGCEKDKCDMQKDIPILASGVKMQGAGIEEANNTTSNNTSAAVVSPKAAKCDEERIRRGLDRVDWSWMGKTAELDTGLCASPHMQSTSSMHPTLPSSSKHSFRSEDQQLYLQKNMTEGTGTSMTSSVASNGALTLSERAGDEVPRDRRALSKEGQSCLSSKFARMSSKDARPVQGGDAKAARTPTTDFHRDLHGKNTYTSKDPLQVPRRTKKKQDRRGPKSTATSSHNNNSSRQHVTSDAGAKTVAESYVRRDQLPREPTSSCSDHVYKVATKSEQLGFKKHPKKRKNRHSDRGDSRLNHNGSQSEFDPKSTSESSLSISRAVHMWDNAEKIHSNEKNTGSGHDSYQQENANFTNARGIPKGRKAYVKRKKRFNEAERRDFSDAIKTGTSNLVGSRDKNTYPRGRAGGMDSPATLKKTDAWNFGRDDEVVGNWDTEVSLQASRQIESTIQEDSATSGINIIYEPGSSDDDSPLWNADDCRSTNFSNNTGASGKSTTDENANSIYTTPSQSFSERVGPTDDGVNHSPTCLPEKEDSNISIERTLQTSKQEISDDGRNSDTRQMFHSNSEAVEIREDSVGYRRNMVPYQANERWTKQGTESSISGITEVNLKDLTRREVCRGKTYRDMKITTSPICTPFKGRGENINAICVNYTTEDEGVQHSQEASSQTTDARVQPRNQAGEQWFEDIRTELEREETQAAVVEAVLSIPTPDPSPRHARTLFPQHHPDEPSLSDCFNTVKSQEDLTQLGILPRASSPPAEPALSSLITVPLPCGPSPHSSHTQPFMPPKPGPPGFEDSAFDVDERMQYMGEAGRGINPCRDHNEFNTHIRFTSSDSAPLLAPTERFAPYADSHALPSTLPHCSTSQESELQHCSRLMSQDPHTSGAGAESGQGRPWVVGGRHAPLRWLSAERNGGNADEGLQLTMASAVTAQDSADLSQLERFRLPLPSEQQQLPPGATAAPATYAAAAAFTPRALCRGRPLTARDSDAGSRRVQRGRGGCVPALPRGRQTGSSLTYSSGSSPTLGSCEKSPVFRPTPSSQRAFMAPDFGVVPRYVPPHMRRGASVTPAAPPGLAATATYPITGGNSDEAFINFRRRMSAVHSSTYATEQLVHRQLPVGFIDSHCHLDFLFRRDLARKDCLTLSEYRHRVSATFPCSFAGCVAVFCEPSFWAQEQRWRWILSDPDVWGAFGCHPHHVDAWSAATEQQLTQICRHPRVVALGEIGLDYSVNNSTDHELQQQVFRRQIEIGVSLGLPLVLHVRDAEQDALRIARELIPRSHPIHRHCITGNLVMVLQWLEAFPNCYVGFTPIICTARNNEAKYVAQRVPLSRVLLETDAPYFLPHCYKHSQQAELAPSQQLRFSHPGLALHVAAQLAQMHGRPLQEVVRVTADNTRSMYRLPPAGQQHAGPPPPVQRRLCGSNEADGME